MQLEVSAENYPEGNGVHALSELIESLVCELNFLAHEVGRGNGTNLVSMTYSVSKLYVVVFVHFIVLS